MANEDQLKLLKEGVEVWNNWRKIHPQEKIKLYNAELFRADLKRVNLNGAYLREVHLDEADLQAAKFNNADLSGADLSGANLTGADLRGADLSGANLAGADLTKAKLTKAKLFEANLGVTKFLKADLRNADFMNAFCYRANFSNANLYRANFYNTNLVEANIEQASLSNSRVYGISSWGLKGIPKDQSNLIITNQGEAEITVDDIQMAQFIYFLLNNQNVRNVIDTITSKTVLILGRFTPERKQVLNLVREELHKQGYVAILFDFENTNHQSLLETIMTLAGMAKFIIADVTAATMVREELRSVVEKYPAKPIQPLLLRGEQEYATLSEMRLGFKNILPTFIYKDTSEVVSELSDSIVVQAEKWLKVRKAQLLNGGKTEREMVLEKEIESLKKQLEIK